MATSSPEVTNEADVGLPTLSPHRRSTWDYYRLRFLPDGYPGRLTDGQLHAHPLYGPYVIADYLGQYRRTKDVRFLDAAEKVAAAALERMRRRGDALVFEYEPGVGLSSLPERFYSGLTQSRYLSTLGRLEEAFGHQHYLDASEAILRSLTLPVEDGGVARRTPSGGLLIEEYAHAVPDYTLNGWTTATLLVHEYANAVGSGHAHQIVAECIEGIADVLPLYDVPELANSRYRLTGPVKVRVVVQELGARLLAAGVDVPGQGFYPVTNSVSGKWTNRLVSGVAADGTLEKTTASLELLICQLSWPRKNVLRLHVDVPTGGRLGVKVGKGVYAPLTAAVKVTEWEAIHSTQLAPGQHYLEVPIPWRAVDLAAYPTNFSKTIGGRNYNQYHFIHVTTLTKLLAIRANDTIEAIRDRWAAYPSRWPEMPVYRDADISLEQWRGRD